MRASVKLLAGCVALAWIGQLSPAAAGGWKYAEGSRQNPGLTYSDDGKAMFMLLCGRAFALHLKYPDKAGKDGDASVTLSTPKAQMKIDGQFEELFEDSVTDFVQWDLGYRRQDPELYGKQWKALQAKLLDLLESGEPLTISAGAGSYQLPPIDVRNWRAPFNECG
jgi:hypothetical protein